MGIETATSESRGTDDRSRAPRLLFLGHGAERTGPPILLGHLLRGLAPGPYDISVVVERDGPLLDEYRRAGARSLAVTGRREPLEALTAGLRRAGAAWLIPIVHGHRRQRTTGRLDRPDLVYVNAATPPTAALLRALDPPTATPVVLHVHELDIGLRMALRSADLRLLLDRADHIIAASHAVADLLVEGHDVDPRCLSTCSEFVDRAALDPEPTATARARLGIPEADLVIGSIGLPDWRKDPEHLLRAVAHLRTTHPLLHPWVVWVGGDPSSDDGRRLADEAARLGLRARFVHHGHTARPDRLLGVFDVFALPAREDALPLAALEAAAVALPLVCFRTGGVARLCDDGAGIAVDYPDTAAFSTALSTLLLDEALRQQIGATGASLVAASHDLDVGVARIRCIIDHCVGEASGADPHRSKRAR